MSSRVLSVSSYETTSSEDSSSEESMEEQRCEGRDERDPTGGAGESDVGPEAPDRSEGPHEDQPCRSAYMTKNKDLQ